MSFVEHNFRLQVKRNAGGVCCEEGNSLLRLLFGFIFCVSPMLFSVPQSQEVLLDVVKEVYRD